MVLSQYLQLVLFRRVVNDYLECEAVELRLRQRVGALVFDGVLGRKKGEVGGERMSGALDGHLALLHSLEESRLRLGGRAVDLIGQQQLGEDRPPAQVEGRALHVEDVGAHDVGGHQVGGELDAAELPAEAQRQPLDEHGLGGSRHTLDEGVSSGDDGDDHLLDDRALPGDDAAQHLFNLLGELSGGPAILFHC